MKLGIPADRREGTDKKHWQEKAIKYPVKDFGKNYRPKNWISNRPVNMAPIVAISPGIMNE